MPACGLRRGSRGGPVRPIFINTSSRPSRGAKPHRADDMKLPQEQPHQAGSRGGGEIKARVPREEPVMQAVMIDTRRAPACAESLFPLWCKGGKRRQGYQAKATISVQQDQDQQGGRTEVIMEPKPASSSGSFGRQGPTLVRISVLDVPLQNGQLLAPFPLNIWEEAQGLRL